LASFGQTPPPPAEKAPPEVDAALRARITRFYQLEVEGKFSQALQLVAEDTKDAFVESNKSGMRSFEIQSIRYTDDFTKAEVMALISRFLPMEGFMGRPLQMKTPSRWKLDNGLWCYYEDPQKDRPGSPFRHAAPPGMPVPNAGPPGAPGALPPQPTVPNPRALTLNKPGVQFQSTKPSADQVVISNSTFWPVKLLLSDPRVAGLTIKLDAVAINPGGKAIMHVQWTGAAPIPKAPVTIKVLVDPTNQIVPITVSFTN